VRPAGPGRAASSGGHGPMREVRRLRRLRGASSDGDRPLHPAPLP
jgi:hypothetical protein